MKFKSIVGMLLLIVGMAGQVAAQEVKIGYANISLILAYMPEMATIEEQLETYSKKLDENLRTKEDLFRTKYSEYAQRAETENLTEEQMRPMAEELQKMDEDIRSAAADAEQKLATKRQSLLEPVLDKLDKAIKELVEAESYDYILNTIDGSGTAIIVHGLEGDDVTRDLMARLGIKIPEN